jgi:hypothetical protein
MKLISGCLDFQINAIRVIWYERTTLRYRNTQALSSELNPCDMLPLANKAAQCSEGDI